MDNQGNQFGDHSEPINSSNDYNHSAQQDGFKSSNYAVCAQESLPNSTTVLVLGIISIVVCCVGFITAIIALVLASKDKKLYEANPGRYSSASLSNLNAGKVCAIIGLVLSCLAIIYYITIVVFAVIMGNSVHELDVRSY